MALWSGSTPPARLDVGPVHLRPVTPADAEEDLAALLDARLALRQHTGSPWPPDDWSLADDRDDLQRDHDRHGAGEAFTFTLLETSSGRVVGCLYLWPAVEQLTRYGAEAAVVAALGTSAVSVEWWLRPAWEQGPFEQELVTAVRRWLESEWRFPRTVWVLRECEARQARVLQQAGLRRLLAFDSGPSPVVLYGSPVP